MWEMPTKFKEKLSKIAFAMEKHGI